jgi:hypothetical protein
MPMQFLEPSIQQRIIEVFDKLSESDSNDELYEKFMGIIRSIAATHGLSNELVNELENMFLLRTRETLDLGYRKGIQDGLKLRRS